MTVRQVLKTIRATFADSAEAGQMLNLSPQRISQLVLRGELEAYRVGRKKFIVRSDVEKLAKQRRRSKNGTS